MIAQYLRLMRVHHWVKNFFVFVPLIFSHRLFHEPSDLRALVAFIAFSLATSAVYVVNDVVDAEADRRHPKKKNRPIASGAISPRKGLVLVGALLAGAAGVLTQTSLPFALIVAGYLALNAAYSFYLKHVVLVDIFAIAGGFMLRVFGGAVAIDVETSSWLILTTMFLSLFLAVMKRASEISLGESGAAKDSRKVLRQYSVRFVDQIATVTAGGVILSYALYTVSPRTVAAFGSENMIYTLPFVVFGILRFMYIAYHRGEGENAIDALTSDAPMIVAVLLYILAAVSVIYNTTSL